MIKDFFTLTKAKLPVFQGENYKFFKEMDKHIKANTTHDYLSKLFKEKYKNSEDPAEAMKFFKEHYDRYLELKSQADRYNKVMAARGIVGTGAVGYLGYRYYTNSQNNPQEYYG